MKVSDVGKNLFQVVIVGDTVPDGEFCSHLIDGGGRDQTSTPGIKIELAQRSWRFRIAKRGWEVSVQSSSHDITTHHDLIAAPCMIGPAAIARERSREIAGGESDHIICHTEAVDRVLEALERLADGPQVVVLVVDQFIMVVPAKVANKENLTILSQRALCSDRFGDHPQLLLQTAEIPSEVVVNGGLLPDGLVELDCGIE